MMLRDGTIYWRAWNKTAANKAPTIGPTTGIQLWLQSLVPLFFIGRMACMMRGPRSLAGLIA